MNKITDEQLDARLSAYHEIEPTRFPAFVPSKAAKPSPVLPFRNPRMMATAASIVLVTILGISVYFLLGNKSPISVANNESPVAAEGTTAGTAFTDAPSVAAVADSTESAGTDRPTSTAATSPATQPATNGSGIVTAPTRSYDAPINASNAVLPTSAANTAPDSPPDELGSSETRSPAPKPTDHSEVPTAAPITEEPTQPDTPDIKTLRLVLPFTEITAESDESDATLFCCVYDSNGNPLGDSDLYSRSHLVGTKSDSYQSDGVVYSYAVDYDANQVPDNRFTYKVYLRNGKVILQGTVEA